MWHRSSIAVNPALSPVIVAFLNLLAAGLLVYIQIAEARLSFWNRFCDFPVYRVKVGFSTLKDCEMQLVLGQQLGCWLAVTGKQ